MENFTYTIEPPSETPETERQFFFMEKAKEKRKQMELELGRPLTFYVTTFGC